MEWLYDFSILTKFLHNLLTEYIPVEWFVSTIELVLIGVLFLALFAIICLVLVYAERKVCAHFQQRLGPMRVGFHGIFQTIADFIKLLFKEVISIKNADQLLFNIAPFIVIIAAFMAFAAIPFAKGFHAVDLDVGLLYVMAVSSMGVVGILLAGWSSNNKYSLVGAMRSGAQIVSYELSVGLSLLTIITFAGTMKLSAIVDSQANGWWLFKGHIPALIAFIIFLIASTAEVNRGPFDLAEAESELVAGFHTEYSGIKFAFFFLAEYMNMFVVAAIATTVFLGGWQPLYISGLEGLNTFMAYIPPIVWFFGKTAVVIFLIMWFKWTFPRLRIDQLLTLEWKYLMPLNLMNLMLTAFLVLMGWHF